MEEMNATVLEVAKSASNAATSADQAKNKAEEGANAVSQVVQGIAEVQHQSQEMKSDMQHKKIAQHIVDIQNSIQENSPQEIIEKKLDMLTESSIENFSNEESYMQTYKYHG